MKRKVLAMAMAAVMALGLGACGEAASSSTAGSAASESKSSSQSAASASSSASCGVRHIFRVRQFIFGWERFRSESGYRGNPLYRTQRGDGYTGDRTLTDRRRDRGD